MGEERKGGEREEGKRAIVEVEVVAHLLLLIPLLTQVLSSPCHLRTAHSVLFSGENLLLLWLCLLCTIH